MWPRGGAGRVRPPRDHPRLGRRDRLRAAGVVLLAGLAAALVLNAVGGREQEDPAQVVGHTRQDLADAVAQQLQPTFDSLRQQATALARDIAVHGPELVPPVDGSSQRWYWLTDSAGLVRATSPAARGLLGRSRPLPSTLQPSVAAGRTVVGLVAGDKLLGTSVLSVHAPRGSRVLTVAVPSAQLGVDAVPVSRSGTLVALLSPPTPCDEATADCVVRTVATAPGARKPADLDLVGAVDAARRSPARPVPYEGEGKRARLAGVAAVGPDGWWVVAEGTVPRAVRDADHRTTLRIGTGLAALATLLALSLGLAVVRRTARRAEAVQHALLTVTGHELRTPLTIIIGSSRTLISRWDRLDDGRRKDLASAVGRQARQLDRLVERLLHAGRLAAGQSSELSVRATDVSALTEGVLEEMRRLSPLHTFRVEVRPGTPHAAADERGLAQVLEHLLDNAVKYSPDGGEVVVAVEPEGRVQRRVRISVSDEGIGLPADTSRLFRPFGQAQDVNTRTTDEGGVGVGLSIVKDLVTAMGGTVHAERRSVGSLFVVVLPAASD